jgi:hypothetical protein
MKQFQKEGNALRIDPKKGFRIHLLVVLLTIPALWITWSLTNSSYPWPIWNTAVSATGLFFHRMAVYVFRKKFNAHLKTQQVIN